MDFSFVAKSTVLNLFVGIMLVVFGLLFLLSNFGVIPVVEWNKLWPLILVLLGIAFLLKAGMPPNEKQRSWL